MAVIERLDRIETVEAFDAWVLRPENAERDYEWICGRIYAVVSNNRSSGIGHLLGSLIGVFVHQQRLGFTTGADGGYAIGDERYIPDVAFVSAARQVKRTTDAYLPLAPDLAIEVLSPSNSDFEIRVKIANYLLAGTTLWVVDPDREHVEIYAPGSPVRIVRRGNTLSGGDLLPGFAVELDSLFDEGDDAEG